MGIATAVTDGNGEYIRGGISMSDLTYSGMQERQLNPWDFVKNLKLDDCVFGAFLGEHIVSPSGKHKRAAVNSAPYATLSAYALRTKNPRLTAPSKYGKAQGARMISVAGTDYLLYAGKIYERKSK